MIYGKILAGLRFMAVAVVMLPVMLHAQGEGLEAALDRYVRTHEAEIGIAVITDCRDTICVNNDRRYPMNSVMKLYHDVGFVRLPDGRSYSVAVFVESSRYDMSETERMIAEISEIVWRYVSKSGKCFWE